jgi:hypothetical protein
VRFAVSDKANLVRLPHPLLRDDDEGVAEAEPDPNETDIRDFLARKLCRWSYPEIIRAVKAAASRMR